MNVFKSGILCAQVSRGSGGPEVCEAPMHYTAVLTHLQNLGLRLGPRTGTAWLWAAPPAAARPLLGMTLHMQHTLGYMAWG